MAILHYVYPTPAIHGSRGGTTFSRARPTPTARQLTKQHYRHTARRNAIITHPARVNRIWHDDLSPQQRTDWKDLGDATNWTDAEGNPYNPSGYALFARANLLLSQVDLPGVLPAPGSADGVHYAITYAESGHNLFAQMFDDPAVKHQVTFFLSIPCPLTRYYCTRPFIAFTSKGSPRLHTDWTLIFTPADGFDDTRRHFIRDRPIYPDGSAATATITPWEP